MATRRVLRIRWTLRITLLVIAIAAIPPAWLRHRMQTRHAHYARVNALTAKRASVGWYREWPPSWEARLDPGYRGWLGELVAYDATLTDSDLDCLLDAPRLRTVCLVRVGITDQGLERLAQIRSLRSLTITDTQMSRDGIRRFHALRPEVYLNGQDAEFLRERPPSTTR